MKSKNISITGLGWLGLPLAQHLRNLSFTVKGSVTNHEKAGKFREQGLETFVMELTESGIRGTTEAVLQNTDVLIVMIPPGLRRDTGADYVLKMTYYLKEIERHNIRKVLLVSSTSVYGDSQGCVSEGDMPVPDTEAGRQLLQVEQLFFTSEAFKATLVRFGGLLGGTRQPANNLAGRKNLRNGDAPVNLIHRGDCINILSEIILQDAFGHIFNAVHPSHPSKREYYTTKALALNLEPPHYLETTKPESFKEVRSSNLQEMLGYTFQYDI